MGSARCLPEWGLLPPPNPTPKVFGGQEPVGDARFGTYLLVLAFLSAFTCPMGLSSWFRAQRPYRSIRSSSTSCILCISSCFLHSYLPTDPPVALSPPLPALSFSPVISLPGRLGASRAVQTTLFMSVIFMLIQCFFPGAQGT